MSLIVLCRDTSVNTFPRAHVKIGELQFITLDIKAMHGSPSDGEAIRTDP